MRRLCLILLYLVNVIFSQDPCWTKNQISDWTRSVAYSDTHGRCDSGIRADWFIVTSMAGSEMPIECPGGLRCGTTFPMYLSANHSDVTPETLYPAPGQTVDRVACSASFSGDCCQEQVSIKIKNCGPYFVYFLRPPASCPTAYCFGTNRPCPEGENSETGFTPECGTFTNITVTTPTVTTGLFQTFKKNSFGKEYEHNSVQFQCHTNVESRYTYDVRWYIDDFEIYEAKHINQSAIGLSTSTMLHQNLWDKRFKPNMMVKCSVQIRDINFSAPGPRTYSNPYFAGVVVDQKTNILKEGVSIDIPVHLTIPVGCNFPRFDAPAQNVSKTKLCVVNIVTATYTFESKGSCTKGDLEYQNCGLVFYFEYTNWNTPKNINITGATDGKINFGDRVAVLQLYNNPNETTNIEELNFWKGIMLEQLNFIVVDQDQDTSGKLCQSNNDPHMVTFDGRRYELQKHEGEYVMYKHARLPVVVHSFFERCNEGSALCNCGAAVRSGNSVFTANFCGANQRVVEKVCEEKDMQISKWNSNGFSIKVPSGAIIQINMGAEFKDSKGLYLITHFTVLSSPLDLLNSRGLCGVYSHNTADDFLMSDGLVTTDNASAFADSWRILQPKKSIFNNDHLEPFQTKAPEYCTCTKDEKEFPYGNPDMICNITMSGCRDNSDHTWSYKKPCRQNHQRRQTREVEMIPDEEPEFYPLELNNTNSFEPDMSWKNGWTEQKAIDHCKSAFNNVPAKDLFSTYVPAIHENNFISDCVVDIQITGDTEWVDASIDNFVSNCISEAGRMEILTMSNSTNDTEAELGSIFEIMASMSCPRNCSGNGICSKGTCNCTENYFGDDCSLPVTMAPIIAKGKFSGVCDTSERPCNLYIIPGMYFTNGNMTCRFRPFLIDFNITIDEGITEEEVGIYKGPFLMHCKAPLTRHRRAAENNNLPGGFYLSVSNDGLNFTEEVQLLVYNKLCYNCNKTTLMCTEIETCPENQVPVVNIYVNSEKTTHLAAGICSGILFVGICVVLVAVLKIKKGNKIEGSLEYQQSQPPQEHMFIKS